MNISNNTASFVQKNMTPKGNPWVVLYTHITKLIQKMYA